MPDINFIIIDLSCIHALCQITFVKQTISHKKRFKTKNITVFVISFECILPFVEIIYILITVYTHEIINLPRKLKDVFFKSSADAWLIHVQ